MKKRVIFNFVVLISLTVVLGSCGRSRLAGKVSTTTIRQIKYGMSKDEVIKILGHPFSIEPCSFEYYGANAFTMNYSQPIEYARWYPMLWIHLKNNKVVEVYAKRYIMFGADDKGVYGLDDKRNWESAEFETTFPNP
jgi:hypothetical protein